jgi:hypothetical protein
MNEYPRQERAGLSGTMLALILVGLALIVLVAVLAWSPWTEDEGGIAPGQGGDDSQSGTPTLPGQVPLQPTVVITPILPGGPELPR